MLQTGLNNNSNNVVKLHSNKALMAVRLMEQRRVINLIDDPLMRVAKLAIWKIDAERYWENFK